MKTKLVFLTLAMMAAVNTGFSQAVAFTQITNGAIATDMGTYTRSAWGDFNNDGYLDLFVSNWDHRTNVFYWNNGDGTFTKLTQGDPVQDADYHTGAAAADFDNDGYLDLLVSTGGPSAASRNLLYHNNGDGTFSRVSGGIVTNQLGFFNACTWADYDNDGYVDLFITDTGDANNDGGKSLLFHNNGNGTFTKVTSGAVVNDISVGNGALWADYDNDGFMDLIVINIANNGHNFLYHNNRNGTFTRILTNAIVTDSWLAGAEGAAWGDYDNDGLLDLFVTDNNGTRNRLYHNNGNGAFTNVSSGPMLVPRTGFASGAAWGDYDNDGYLDLFVAYYGATNALYHNNGDGTFTQILIGAPVDNNGSGIYSDAPTWVDYDNDGFLDLFVTRHSFNGIPTGRGGARRSTSVHGSNARFRNRGAYQPLFRRAAVPSAAHAKFEERGKIRAIRACRAAAAETAALRFKGAMREQISAWSLLGRRVHGGASNAHELIACSKTAPPCSFQTVS